MTKSCYINVNLYKLEGETEVSEKENLWAEVIGVGNSMIINWTLEAES